MFKKAIFGVIILFLLSLRLFAQHSGAINKTDTLLFTDFLKTSAKADTVSVAHSLDFSNFFSLFNCLSGTVFFSGPGFPSTIAIQYRGRTTSLKPYFERCISGSKFTLDNCSFERDGGLKPVFVTKTVVFR